MEKALFTLAGVIVGFILNFVKDVWQRKREQKKEIEFISIRLSYALDKFLIGCFDVVYDEGLYQGQTDKNGYRFIQSKTPEFSPDEIDINWKLLPSKLLYEILNFPNEIDSSNHLISGAFEYAASPPDFEEGFEERQYEYAQLGIKSFEFISELRNIGGLPVKEYEEWYQIDKLKETIVNIKNIKKKRAEASAKIFD